jgi:uncharacterized protein
MKFEWDSNKEKINIKKHKVSFQEAKTVFYDDNALLIPDPGHSNNEDRFIILGLSSDIKELVVSFCERNFEDEEELIRIISSRKAERDEKKQYWKRRGL